MQPAKECPSAARLIAVAAAGNAAWHHVAGRFVAAGMLDPLNPFCSGTSGPVTPEDRARREQARNELQRPAEPRLPHERPLRERGEHRRLGQAIERYKSIVAAGRLARSADREHDQGSAILAPRSPSIRRQLALSGDLAERQPQPALRRRVSGRARALPDPQRPAGQRLRRFAHARRAECHRRRSASSSSRPISPASNR